MCKYLRSIFYQQRPLSTSHVETHHVNYGKYMDKMYNQVCIFFLFYLLLHPILGLIVEFWIHKLFELLSQFVSLKPFEFSFYLYQIFVSSFLLVSHSHRCMLVFFIQKYAVMFTLSSKQNFSLSFLSICTYIAWYRYLFLLLTALPSGL